MQSQDKQTETFNAGDSNTSCTRTQCVDSFLRSLCSFVSIVGAALPARHMSLDRTFDLRPLQISPTPSETRQSDVHSELRHRRQELLAALQELLAALQELSRHT